MELIYSLTESNELRMQYRAASDQSTPLNLTNHAYWNLGGEGSGFIGGHILTIHADYYTPSDNLLIPTGEIRSVAGTTLDFRRPKTVETEMKKIGGNLAGYDYNFVLNKSEFGALELAATVIHPASGRRMDVLTTEPGIQFYTGNSLDGTIVGKSGAVYGLQSGFLFRMPAFPRLSQPSALSLNNFAPGTRIHPDHDLQVFHLIAVFNSGLDVCF